MGFLLRKERQEWIRGLPYESLPAVACVLLAQGIDMVWLAKVFYAPRAPRFAFVPALDDPNLPLLVVVPHGSATTCGTEVFLELATVPVVLWMRCSEQHPARSFAWLLTLEEHGRKVGEACDASVRLPPGRGYVIPPYSPKLHKVGLPITHGRNRARLRCERDNGIKEVATIA